MGKIRSVNPATGELNGEFDLYSQQMVDQKIENSRKAFDEWKKEPIVERTFSIECVAEVLRSRREELAETITKEMGKPIKESLAEIDKCAWTCDYFAEKADTFLAAEFVETDAETSGFVYEPVGTVLSIMPWNFPFWQALRFGIPALAGGNTVLLKHASNVPMCALEIEKIFIEAGVPEGVYQTLLVDGPTASSLISRNEISAVTFTGSKPAGEKVAEAAGRNIKKVVLELGGSDPLIVLDDADIEKVAKAAVSARFQNCGQSCIAAKRLLIDETIVENFTDLFLDNVSKLRIGDPMDPETDMGPLSSKGQMELIKDQVDKSIKMGANVLAQGGPQEGDGYFYMPTVLSNIAKEAPVVIEETFGPVAPIITFSNEEEAIEIANSTEYGLGASIWSKESQRAMRMTRHIEAGIIAVNNIVASDPRLPFGGMKKSGVGRELYRIGMLEFMTVKSMKVY
ncbi:NAD-dependent succinate-semialdehyde dehydrogenase [Methanolobus profundi]|uniref:Succinate-semialdehyde dehydrogenase / glutarate-semialdehyde dehydrogenase n=1 Tax=Methanolobus profundi TaxID=487685 RepID=A0A1I4T170_9EURY|nr:NAD-dependent succinate-semialdehyde dehydrogenase [Methanolobus profundi]SFM70474.1 succinate-semialdehyde dehydrogenase / glutarate-semialdehyde dehydrogenase [Methanolobus profundi]